MLSECRQVINEELRAAERRILARLEPLFEAKGELEYKGTFEETANLFIPAKD